MQTYLNLDLFFIKKIKTRLLKQNKNWLCVICGETGSGKSYSALSIGNMIGQTHLVFKPIDFLKLITSKELNKGDVVICDEFGVGMAAREWQSTSNKLLGAVMQTFRNLNIGVIFTLPNLSFIDVQARKLFHNYLETANLDYKSQTALLKCYEIQHNSRLDKTYFKFPMFTAPDGNYIRMTHVRIPKPSNKIIEKYEVEKSRYTENLNLNALKSLMEEQEKKKSGLRKTDFVMEKKIIKQVVANSGEFLSNYKNREYIDFQLIKNKYEVSDVAARRIKNVVEKQLSST